MNQKGSAAIIAIVVVVLVLGIGAGAWYYMRPANVPPEPENPISAVVIPPSTVSTSPAVVIPPSNSSVGIVVTSPQPNELVKLPITVTGYIIGNGWTANEGEVGNVEVFDANGKSISNKEVLKATTDWLKLPTSFQATVGDREMMAYLQTTTGVVKITSNGAKNGETSLTFSLPVRFAATPNPISQESFQNQPSKIVSVTTNGEGVTLGLDFVSLDPHYSGEPPARSPYINLNSEIRYFYLGPSAVMAPCFGRESLERILLYVQDKPEAIWNFNIANGSVTKMSILLWGTGLGSCPS